MLQQYITDLEQDPFDGKEFVERLAWRVHTLSSQEDKSSFDPDLLHSAFVDAIQALNIIDDQIAKKCKRLEASVKEEELQHWHHIALLLDQNRDAFQSFQELDSHINSVSTKVVHLGDQLENVNTPRSRAVEAQRLMNHFAEFLADGPLVSEVFTDKTRIYEAADVIQKLFLISQELPKGKFEVAIHNIFEKYDEIERSLIMEFVKAHRSNDRDRMKEIATTLLHFKGYPQCVTAFIEEQEIGALRSKDIFSEIVPLCMKSDTIIREVFINPDQVTAKFVIHIYQKQLNNHIRDKLEHKASSEVYLRNLYDLYSQTNKLSIQLQSLNLGSDAQFLPKLTKQIFHQYLSAYISVETRYLKEKFKLILSRFYESKGHQKKNIQTGGMNEIREKIQDVISSKANINLGPSGDAYSGETFLSEDIAVSLLQETKLAFKRCQLLSISEVHNNAVEIFDLLTKALLSDHVDYALELAIQSIPGGEVRQPPELGFLEVVQQSSSMINHLDKLFSDSLIPLITSTPKHGECLQKKKRLMQNLELRFDVGLEKSLNAATSYIRYMLNVEQKRTDFRPDNDDILMANATTACQRVVRWVNRTAEKIRNCLDGQNLDSVLLEFGLRLHRTILDHMFKFDYNCTGAMAIICDVNEYRKCVAGLKQPLVNTLFDTMHTLCKLLQVSPENLKMVCSEEQLSNLDRTVLASFIQLRSDYKTEKLGSHFK